MARMVGYFLVTLFLVSELSMVQPQPLGNVCLPVYIEFPYCLGFLWGLYKEPGGLCCETVKRLNLLAKQGLGAKYVCWCIENMTKCIAKTSPYRLNATRISELPKLCNTHLSFPISVAMDCSK
ncbi:hypothetical protein JCGZ_25756 [Jatropha curcas]|uniref:Bifunctional inhibitor/plant lipid transfer protein/seed storage helical domain-containing protein n=2 Tax=Jatropha curcas TaxID=180498 RepID=A0A067JX37_JATCU|nr:hypothetical protein JCGZ_25756 [Jatropha curcas]